MSRSLVALAAALAVLLLAAGAAAEPRLDRPVHLTTPSEVVTEGGSKLSLPPGYYLTEDLWDKMDLEVKRLQEQEIRLAAENRTLEREVKRGPRFGFWAGMGAGLILGIALGASAL